ncbi:hypothetical protein FW781_21370 [Chryseobacterium panacisoli]|uniref:Uncharacterized protein n=1 Tax=Chryseobacterium panacisoli TaxID=1807141 RepID=A0A5D8ZD79_9FLAO|nr:hypothetical protein [Chryseobacterium panacisoli]TZF92587.1 hypothetical protein FW781_21370 [Chryseobacterium panacisoli]
MSNKNIGITYLAVTLVFLFGFVLSLNNYSFAGYYIDKMINWLWLLMTIFIIIRFWKKKVIKVYFGLLISGIVLSILPMLIPFFGIIHYFSTIGCEQRIQLDDTYRIERGRPGALYQPLITIYKREGIFEKQVSRIPYSDIIEKTVQPSNETYLNDKSLPIQEAKLINANQDSIDIEYRILNKQKVIYHKNKLNWFDDF